MKSDNGTAGFPSVETLPVVRRFTIRRCLGSRKFHSVFGILVSIGLLVWAFSDVKIHEIEAQLLSAHYWVLIPSTLMFVFHFFIRAWRWYYLLPNGSKTSLRNRFDGIVVGCLANFILPLRAGEFVRPYMLSKVAPVSFAEGFSSIITERFFDLAAAIITFALLIPILPEMPDWVSLSAWILGGIAVGILAFIVGVVLFPSVLLRLFDKCFPGSESLLGVRFRGFLTDFVKSAQILANPRQLFMVLFLTVLVWITNYLLYYMWLYFLDVQHNFVFATVVSVIIALAVAAPSAPGFVGVYQTACIAGFALFQAGHEEALTFSIITHVLQYVLFIGYGVYALSVAGLHLSQLRSEKAEG